MARRDTPRAQLDLFAPARPEDPLAEVYADARRVADALPVGLRFGTSSWAFPGWEGIVYSDRYTESELAHEGLREYAQHPLLGCVGVDRGYYAPIPAADLARYAEQLPEGFPCLMKAPASVTSMALSRGPDARVNPDFLSPSRFADEVLAPIREARFERHVGAVILELPPVSRALRLPPRDFARRLDALVETVPDDIPLAVELRDPALVTDAYVDVLRRRRVAHVYNYWTAMPSIAEQRRMVPVTAGPFVVARLLLRPGTRYEERREAFKPFDRLVDPDPVMRAEVVELAREAIEAAIPAYVLVNNKAEGSSPLTIREVAALYASGSAR